MTAGRISGLVRIAGGLVLANIMWLVNCLTVVRVLGATAALYEAVRCLARGEEPMGWRSYLEATKRYQLGQARLAGYASAAALSVSVLLAMGVTEVGFLSGVAMGWAFVLILPVVAFGLVAPHGLDGADAVVMRAGRDAWLTAICRPLGAARPSLVAAAAVLHLAMVLAVAVAPRGGTILLSSVSVALPAYLAANLFDRSEAVGART